MNLRIPGPRQQFVETVDGVTIDDARKYAGRGRAGLDVVEFVGF